jgi:mannose-6-phosphate isomerase-like protein (cupin superfamily)
MTAEHTAPDQGNGEWVHISPGERFKIRTSAADNGGTYVMLELIADFQYGTRMHIHENEDEHFIVLAGTLRVAAGDRTFNAPAGTALTVARGVPHAWCNLSDTPLRMLVIFSPGHVEGLFKEMASRQSDDVAAILDKYGCRFVGPPLSESIHAFDPFLS